VGAGLFQGFPVSTSSSRTAVSEQAGSKSQLTGLVGAAAILLLLVAFPGLLKNLPQPTLAAVVIAASLSLADIPATVRLWRLSRSDFWLSIAAFAGVAFVGVLEGIAIAVALSILNVFRRAWWPYQTRLGRVREVPGYHDINEYPDGVQLPGIVIYRFDAPLIFANARTFRHEITELADGVEGLRWIVIAAEPITDVDTTASDMLEELDKMLGDREITLVFAEMKNPVRTKLERYGLRKAIGSEDFYPTLRVAVEAYQERYGIEWPDPALAPR
jgi:MFS superfamily sulfate permease-like transporter